MYKYCFDDGGRSKYFKKRLGDCAVRAIAIAENKDYMDAFNDLKKLLKRSPSRGVTFNVAYKYLTNLGYKWHTCKKGTYFNPKYLPCGKFLLIIKGIKDGDHIVYINGDTYYDTYKSYLNGRRKVYEYFYKEGEVNYERH